ncbi:hypothetical protein [Arthrobacter sp. A2-55]|uniref:hypothetical protein n=1 Tax=Arthrobacter sp. A2-55 TaxID=2897337 RepID=UPI0021CDD63B|nr:hypothetical protein [Arthrobacter sp. A2-55]MCU6480507.1 hypothetical protein [Arthrobacter sp. A2-55]
MNPRAPKRTAFTSYPKRLVPTGYGGTDKDGNTFTVHAMERFIDGQWVPDPIVVKRRFTDAELAAIYWAPNRITNTDLDFENDFDNAIQIVKERQDTLYRFATLPDYDAEDGWDLEPSGDAG